MPEQRYYRRVFHMPAEVSPNIRLAQAQIARGETPTNEVVIPGVKTWDEYCRDRIRWDKIKQAISLDAEFYEGAENLMYPPEWIDGAEDEADRLKQGGVRRTPEALGIDSAMGGDNTAYAVIDRLGLLHLESAKTVDTSVISKRAQELMREYKIEPDKVYFDSGGGGRQHADYLRRAGYAVKTVDFGGAATPPKKRGVKTFDQRVAEDEDRAVYFNRRAELYGILRIRINPAFGQPFALPRETVNDPRRLGEPSLRRQMAPIPLDYDDRGRIKLPPKNRRNRDDDRETLTEKIGCSPDELEALLLALFALEQRQVHSTAGAMG